MFEDHPTPGDRDAGLDPAASWTVDPAVTAVVEEPVDPVAAPAGFWAVDPGLDPVGFLTAD